MPLLTNALNIAIKGLSGLIEVKDIGYTNLFANIDIPQLLKANYIYEWSSELLDIMTNIISGHAIP